MIFLDSSVFIDYFNGNENRATDILHSFLGYELIVIGSYVYLEVLQGLKNDNDFKIAKELLNNFTSYNLSGKELMLQSANNYRFLRKKGITIRKTIDTIIATYCIENNYTLLQSDRDFLPFKTYLGLNLL